MKPGELKQYLERELGSSDGKGGSRRSSFEAAAAGELWGDLEFLEDPAWPPKLVVGGFVAIPLPTALSGLAVLNLKNVLPWYASVAAGPILLALLIPAYAWSSPSNVFLMVAVIVTGVAASVALVKAVRAVAISDITNVRK